MATAPSRVGRERVGVMLLPLPPDTIDVDVDRPEDRVVRGGEVREHVAGRRVRIQIAQGVKFAVFDADDEIAPFAECLSERCRRSGGGRRGTAFIVWRPGGGGGGG